MAQPPATDDTYWRQQNAGGGWRGYTPNYDPNKDPTNKSPGEQGDPALQWGKRAVDDMFSAETVAGPDAGSYYYGGSKGYMPARAGMLDQRGDLAYSQGQQSLDMTRQAALGKGPSAAAQLARSQADAAQRGGLSLARSGRAGTGSSATRDALFANAQTQQSGIQAAALARSQEQMAAQQQYAAQTMAQQQQAASEAGRMREAQLAANAQYETGRLTAAQSNQDADLRKDQTNMLFGGALLAGLSDERSKRRIADLEAEVNDYRRRESPEAPAGDEPLDIDAWDASQARAGRTGKDFADYGDDDPDADARAYYSRRVGRQGAPPDLDPEDVAAWLESQGESAPETAEGIARRRAVSAAQHQARADARRTGQGGLSAMRADLRAGQEASDTFAAMRPMQYAYEQPGPGAPPGPQVGFSAQSVQATPAGRAMTEPGPDGRLRYDGQKALQLTMAGTADQEDRLRRLEAIFGPPSDGRPLPPAFQRVRAGRAEQQRGMGDYYRSTGGR